MDYTLFDVVFWSVVAAFVAFVAGMLSTK